MLKKILIAVICVAFSSSLQASVFEDVASINKGVDGYIVGKALNQEQQKLLETKGLKSDNPNVKKFLATDDLLIAINAKNLKVLAINKRFQQIKQDEVQSLIGGMIHDHEEPTAMAHDKMLYWIYDHKGVKFSEDDLQKWKDSLKKEDEKKQYLFSRFFK